MEKATLDVAIAIAIICLDLVIANNARYKNVFPMLHRSSTKKAPLTLELIRSRIVEYAISCYGFKIVGACKSSRLILKANSSEISLFLMVFAFRSLKSMNGKS